jgi:[acyl-carrier-protein] S-malonyltransferase
MRAFLFSGQGSQAVGMGADLARRCAGCADVFSEADRALGYPLTRRMFEGPEADLRRTEVQQPALLAIAVAQGQHLLASGVEPCALIGHSLGHYAALVVARVLDYAAALTLVAARGRLMQEASPEGRGTMAAVSGLALPQVRSICRRVQPAGVVVVACHNAPGQTVISGETAAVEAAVDACIEDGGGAVLLPVSTAFHSPLVAPMVPMFARLLDAVELRSPIVPVIDNVTALPLGDGPSVRRSLVEQIEAPVLFEESVRFLLAQGVRRFVGCGPGKGVLGFARKIDPGAEYTPFDAAVPLAGETHPPLHCRAPQAGPFAGAR